MRPRGVSRGHVRNDCATCNGSGGVGHECPACQGTGIPVHVGTWRGEWRVKPAPAAVRAAKAPPRLKVTTTDLVLAVESLWTTRSAGPTKPLQAVLEYCEREKGALIANKYCQKASRRVDALDHLIECVWDVLQSGSATVEG